MYVTSCVIRPTRVQVAIQFVNKDLFNSIQIKNNTISVVAGAIYNIYA